MLWPPLIQYKNNVITKGSEQIVISLLNWWFCAYQAESFALTSKTKSWCQVQTCHLRWVRNTHSSLRQRHSKVNIDWKHHHLTTCPAFQRAQKPVVSITHNHEYYAVISLIVVVSCAAFGRSSNIDVCPIYYTCNNKRICIDVKM